jgi:hypothetical protein
MDFVGFEGKAERCAFAYLALGPRAANSRAGIPLLAGQIPVNTVWAMIFPRHLHGPQTPETAPQHMTTRAYDNEREESFPAYFHPQYTRGGLARRVRK